MDGLTIGKVAKAAGLGIETVRFYEREGLIKPLARSASNYRLYTDEGIVRLRFIKRAKALGFTLREIKELLFLRADPDATKGDVKTQIEEKILDINARIKDLQKIQQTLKTLDSCCDGHGSTADCPILAALEGTGELDKAPRQKT
ncbi:Zn(II)-responsive transcriptional regulator/Cu(I)-responsive transcriptional regulator,TIGR02044 [Desulfuromusa kysingii]|uniref:Zn(II)-responsive transcriptional regulator/Cu(I)-responsive transcriptional regulator,TIGR02044 n=1 Tax=Desulfuromusa kysingii TaxID=37625 RepID=A0A1H3WSG5_9BACT|nr:heavy metal-responsive transcriptional regulator [Desulfuromusa kysingii]SDZ89691.1 Zn(II)-responsive transcriptional regulator/Cu(I)-responsive transcriptional regulator,TIGR02044 [Desulfuromusa kysingii]